MSLEDLLARYTDKVAPRAARRHLGYTVKTPANDDHHSVLCGCPRCEHKGGPLGPVVA